MRISINKDAEIVLKTLSENGYESYIVGGCVRDSLMGIVPHDWDICTNAKPNETKELFISKGFKTIDTGIKHGTVTVVCNKENFEVTTYRIDGDYGDHRHPDSVEFTTDITKDLSRRDFTINAMAYNNYNGLVDPFNGTSSARNHEIKCVGNPDSRFTEDPLRIMRAVRFSLRGFSNIDKETERSMLQNCASLGSISKERIQSELCKILQTSDRETLMLNFVRFKSIFFTVIPELEPCDNFNQNNPYHTETVYNHIIKSLYYCSPNLLISLSMLFHDIAKPTCYTEDSGIGHFYGHAETSSYMANGIMRKLKFDNKTISVVSDLVKFHDSDIATTKPAVRRIMNRIGPDELMLLLDVKEADIKAQNHKYISRLDDLKTIRNIVSDIIKENDCLKLSDLKVNGNDLIDLGAKKGPLIGKILNKLLSEIMNDTVSNDHDSLLKRSRVLITEEENR